MASGHLYVPFAEYVDGILQSHVRPLSDVSHANSSVPFCVSKEVHAVRGLDSRIQSAAQVALRSGSTLSPTKRHTIKRHRLGGYSWPSSELALNRALAYPLSKKKLVRGKVGQLSVCKDSTIVFLSVLKVCVVRAPLRRSCRRKFKHLVGFRTEHSRGIPLPPSDGVAARRESKDHLTKELKPQGKPADISQQHPVSGIPSICPVGSSSHGSEKMRCSRSSQRPRLPRTSQLDKIGQSPCPPADVHNHMCLCIALRSRVPECCPE